MSESEDPREPIERWLTALEMSARRYGTAFGIWRPKSGSLAGRRFYANEVRFVYDALYFVGMDGGETAAAPVWQIRRHWERCDPGATDALEQEAER